MNSGELARFQVWRSTFCLSFPFPSLCWFVILLFLMASFHMTQGGTLERERRFLWIQGTGDGAGILSQAERKRSRTDVDPCY